LLAKKFEAKPTSFNPLGLVMGPQGDNNDNLVLPGLGNALANLATGPNNGGTGSPMMGGNFNQTKS
jgi:hypothetical protein